MSGEGECEFEEDGTEHESDSAKTNELHEAKYKLVLEYDRCQKLTNEFCNNVMLNTQCPKHVTQFNQIIDTLKETVKEMHEANTWNELNKVKENLLGAFKDIEKLRSNMSRNRRVKERIREQSRKVGKIMYCNGW